MENCICPVVDLGEDLVLCEGEQKTIQLKDKSLEEIVWQDGSKNDYMLIKQGGIYWVEGRKNNCLKRDSLNVKMIDCSCPEIDLGEDRVICVGEEFKIELKDIDYKYLWQDGSTTKDYVINAPGNYKLIATKNNCTVKDSITITYEYCCIPTFIPNIITPNGDGINDLFYINCLAPDWELVIVNRWGKIVYKSNCYKNEWNGNGCVSGVYYYKLSHKKQKLNFKGYIHLLK